MALSPVFVELKAATGEFRTKIGEAQREIQHLDKIGTGAGLKKLSVVGKAALTGVITSAVAVAAISIHTADAFENSHARLEQSLHNVRSSFQQWQPEITKVDSRMERLGFTNAQTEEGLGNLTTALKSPKLALNQIGLAADLARYKHISLADAATAMARAEEGNLRSLKQIGVDLPIASGGAAKLASAQRGLSSATTGYQQLLEKQHAKHKLTLSDHIALANAQQRVRLAQVRVNETASTGRQIVGALSHLIGGQATSASETFAGKQQRLKVQVEDIATRIGVALIPKVEQLATWVNDHVVPALVSMGGWVNRNRGWLIPLAAAVGVITVGLVVYSETMKVVTGVTKAWAVVQAIINGELDANPIGLVVVGLAALAVGLTYAYRHSETFRNIVQGAFRVVGVAIGFVRDHWRAFVLGFGILVGPLALVVALIITHFNTFKTVVRTVFGAVRTAAGAVVGFFTGPFLRGLGTLVSVAVRGFKFLSDVWFTVVGGIVNAAAKAFGWLPFGVGAGLKSAAKAFNTFHRDSDAVMQGVIDSANGWGRDIGGNLGKGVSEGIDAGFKTHVIRAVTKMADGTVKVTSARFEIASPSRVFYRIGTMLPIGLAGGIRAAAGVALKAVRDLASRISAEVSASQTKLANDLGNRNQLAGQLKQSLVGGADLSNAIDQSTGQPMNIRSFLSDQAMSMQAFSRQIGLLKKQGLSGALLQQVTAAGPTAGGQIASSILSGQAGPIRDLNAMENEIYRAAGSAGMTTASATYGKEIAKDNATLHAQLLEQRRTNQLLAIIARAASGKATAAQTATALRKLKRDLGGRSLNL